MMPRGWTAYERFSLEWVWALADLFAAAGEFLRRIDPFAAIYLREEISTLTDKVSRRVSR